MTLALYLDEHVNAAILHGLRNLGVDVLSVQEDGMAGAPDVELLERCIALNRVIFSHDVDFVAEADRRSEVGEFFAGVVYVHQGQLGIGRCIEELALMAQIYDADEMASLLVYLKIS